MTPRRTKIYIGALILPICLLSFLKGMAQAPGGVSTNLQLWLKAGTGAGSIGSNSSLWQDQSSNGNNATQATAADQPVVTANQINFNPALVFNGTSDYMNIASNLNLGAANCAVYCVVQLFGSGGEVFLGSETGTANDIQLATFPGSPTQVNYWGTGTVLLGTTNLPAGTVYISGHEKAGTGANQATIYINGNVDQTGTISQNTGAGNRMIGASYIGAGPPGYFTNGDIAEMVVYNTALSAANRSKLQSYLSFKYGFPPPTGAGFVASTGLAFWTYNATYANDIFGIGRDDGSGLSLSSSNSINTGSGNGTGQSAKGNIVLSTPSPALNNLDFIAVGDNAGSLAEQTTGLPAGTAAGVERVGRQWKVNHTNAVGTTVTLTFNTTGLTTGSGVTDFSLLIDADGTGNFATAPITSIAATSYSGNIVTFTNVSLPNNAVFTFIVKDAILLPLNFLSFTARLGANQQVNLQWQTSDATNVSHFAVERSTDGSSFTPIGEVNFSLANSYAFTDNNAVAGNNYYRIESVDDDGYTQYSAIDEVTVPEPTLQVKLLNNQPGNEDPVLLFSTGTAVAINIQLLTSDGTVVSRMQQSIAAGQTRQTIATTGLPRGMYIIGVAGGGYSKNFLIVR